MRSGFPGAKIAIQIGIRIPNVPQEVPVANARKQATTKIIAGSIILSPAAEPSTRPATNSFAPRLSVIALSVHANVKIKIAGTIALNPSGTQSMLALKESTLRQT